MIHYLKKLPTQLIISIFTAFFLGQILDLYIVSVFYSISSVLIEILIAILPLMVFGFIFRALIDTKSGTLKLLLTIFAGVTASNCLSSTIAYFFGQTFLPHLGLTHSADMVSKFTSEVPLLFTLSAPVIIGTEVAMALGMGAGLILSFLSDSNRIKSNCRKLSKKLNDGIIWFLNKVFTPLLPLYVFGFCLKLSYDQALVHLFQQFGKVFLLSMFLVVSYIYLFYFISSGNNIKNTWSNIKLMLPAGLVGFSTMSSAATMPMTLICTEKTTNNRNFTDLIIPSTANIHMLGDNLTIVITALTLMSIFGYESPSFTVFLPCVVACSLAKLSCVGVPGGSVLVVLPVLQSYLGFTPEMTSLLTTIYILQDSFGTCANVMGNGAFALFIQRIFFKKNICVDNNSFKLNNGT